MNACFTTGLMQQFHRLFGVLVLSLFTYQMAAYADPAGVGKRTILTIPPVKHADTGSKLTLLKPSANPYALPANVGKQTVLVSVPVRLTGKSKSPETVFLRRRGDKQYIEMNDLGKNGDFLAKDGIFGVYVEIDTREIKPDSCVDYEAFVKQGRVEVISPTLRFCVSSLPVGIDKSNTDKPVVFRGGEKAVADEIVLYATPTTSVATIKQLARSIDANIVGTILPLNLYQLRLPSPVDADRMLEIVAQLKERAGKVSVFVNLIGHGAMDVNDTAFQLPPTDINSQHGLKLVLAHDEITKANAWDAGGTGNNVTVVVLDTGLLNSHPDLDATWTCQDVPLPMPAVPPAVPVVLVPCTDTAVGATLAGHGTQIAGVIAAKTNTVIPTGVAGLAYGGKIHSIKLRNFTLAGMANGFITAAGYVGSNSHAKVINASFTFEATPGSAIGAGIAPLCTSINSAVLSGFGAVVVNAVGNDNNTNAISAYSENFYPARCNDSTNVAHNGLTRKDLLITVANSVSKEVAACGAGVVQDHRCNTSNYGAWVDITAPGSAIYTTTIGNTYTSSTGTSFSAPFVSGAAAILASCGVPLGDTVPTPPSNDGIEYILKNSAIVSVSFPNGTSAPRLDLYRALKQFGAPTGVSVSPVNGVDENVNTASGYEVGTLNTTHAGTCNSFTYSSILGGTDGGLFNIAGDKLRLNAAVPVNYEDPARPLHIYNLIVHVTDFSGTSYDFPLTVTVNNKNDAPTLASPGSVSYVDTAANDSFVNATGTLVGADEDVGNTLTYGVSGGTVAAGVSTRVGTYGTLAVNTTSGAYTFTPNNNAIQALKTNTSESYTVTVTDSVAPPVTATFTVNLTGANDTTNFSGNISASLSEDGTLTGSGTLAVNDRDSGDAAITPQVGTAGTYGVFSIDSGGAWLYTLNNAAANVQALHEGQNVTDIFTVATAGGATQAITMAITGAKDQLTGSLSVNPPEPVLPAIRHVGDGLTAITSLADADCPLPGGLIAPATSSGLCTSAVCTLSYQWMESDTAAGIAVAVSGPVVGTNSTYQLNADNVNKYMSLCVSTGMTMDGSCVTKCTINEASAVGDPHITTVDGLPYDFQGAGEFVALRGANGMEIQLRMAAVPTAPPLPDSYSGLTSGVSVNTAVAARVGKHRVTYQPDTSPNVAGGTFVLRVDGVPTTLPVDGIDLGDGGRVVSQASGIQMDFPDQTTLLVNTSSWPFYGAWWLHVSVFHTPASEGIMGARLKGSWLPMMPKGSALGAMPAALHDRYVELYVKFANSWRVNKETSLFDYDKDASTATFTNKEWPTENGPYAPANTPVAKPLGLKAAQIACADVVGKKEKADCVFDVRVMGNAKIAQGHILTQKIRTGLTAIIVRDDRGISGDKEMVTFTATVARHAAPTRMEIGRKVGALTGEVQFTINGNSVGRPVKLDARGQAQLKLPRLKIEKQTIGARFVPVKGSVFFPSSSFESARVMVEGKR